MYSVQSSIHNYCWAASNFSRDRRHAALPSRKEREKSRIINNSRIIRERKREQACRQPIIPPPLTESGVSPERAITQPSSQLETRWPARGETKPGPVERLKPISGNSVVARPLPIARQRHFRPVKCFLSGSANWQPQPSASLFWFVFRGHVTCVLVRY